jgi:ABC-2 type transport system ATP-binding protein
VLSFDQRGFGGSGGKAHVMNPELEGHDVRRLVALLARQPWVRKDAPATPA